MFAIIIIAGRQYKVFPDKLLYVRDLGSGYKEGAEIIFNTIFITDKVQVKGKIMAHIKENKVTIFKKKRRKGYQLMRGHRQNITLIKIINIDLK